MPFHAKATCSNGNGTSSSRNIPRTYVLQPYQPSSFSLRASLNRDLEGCGITDADLADLKTCFDDIGRSGITVMYVSLLFKGEQLCGHYQGLTIYFGEPEDNRYCSRAIPASTLKNVYPNPWRNQRWWGTVRQGWASFYDNSALRIFLPNYRGLCRNSNQAMEDILNEQFDENNAR